MKLANRIFKPAVALVAVGVMVLLGSFWPAAQSAPSQIQNLKLPKISISIFFGRAKKNCGGWGICKITLGKLTAARTVQAELSRTADGKLELRMLEKASEEGPTLFVDEDIPLSADIARQLGLKSATIQRGEYAFSGRRSVLNARLTK
jgi:hypothetical protein